MAGIKAEGFVRKGVLSEDIIDQIADRVIEKMKATQERQPQNNVDFNKFAWGEASYINE